MTEAVSKILRRKEVLALTGISNSTLYRWTNEGTFPKSVQLGAKTVGWFESDIIDWQNRLKEEQGGA